MNIDQQLRAALSQEAEMQNVPAPPDVDRLISGGKARQRHRNLTRVAWAGLAAAAAVLVAGGVYGVTKINSGDTTVEPAKPPATTAGLPSATTTQPYRMLVGYGANDVAIHAHMTLYGPWGNSDHPILSDDTGSYGGLAVYRPDALAAGTGCLSDQPNTHVGQTPQKLAHQLAHLPRSTVLASPTPMQAFGRNAIHLQLRINPNCGKDVYRVADTIEGGHGISYGKPSTHVVIDFWVENVRGAPVVVETWHQDGASSQMINQISRSRHSISFANRG